MAKLAVHLVAWNGAKYVPHLFASLRNQTFRSWELYVLDNHSTDDTADRIEAECKTMPVPTQLQRNKENSGFAGGHNLLFQNLEASYVLLLNQDMYLEPECLEKLVDFLDTHEDVAAVSPRLMRWDFAKIQTEASQGFTGDIDALGLKILRNRRVIEQYTKQPWSEIQKTLPKQALEVFGISGALPLFRTKALRAVAHEDGSIFDTSFHSYKEDVDLAYRLRSQGFASYVVLDTYAYHDRGGAGPKETSDRAAAKNKAKQSAWVKYHSYKNHLMTLWKNETRENFFRDAVPILWYEFKKFIYFLCVAPHILKGLGEVWKHRSELQEKRIYIKNRRTASPASLRRFWTEHV